MLPRLVALTWSHNRLNADPPPAWSLCPGRRAGIRRRFEDVAQMLEPERRVLGQTDNQVQFAADRFDVAAQGRQIHVGLFLDLGHGRLLDIQGGGDIELSLAGDPPQLAQALDILLQRAAAGVDALLPIGRKLGDNLVKTPAHLTSPAFRPSDDRGARQAAYPPLR
jgi:hypothetical protein